MVNRAAWRPAETYRPAVNEARKLQPQAVSISLHAEPLAANQLRCRGRSHRPAAETQVRNTQLSIAGLFDRTPGVITIVLALVAEKLVAELSDSVKESDGIVVLCPELSLTVTEPVDSIARRAAPEHSRQTAGQSDKVELSDSSGHLR